MIINETGRKFEHHMCGKFLKCRLEYLIMPVDSELLKNNNLSK